MSNFKQVLSCLVRSSVFRIEKMGGELLDNGPSGLTRVVSYDFGSRFEHFRLFIPVQRNTYGNGLGGYNQNTEV